MLMSRDKYYTGNHIIIYTCQSNTYTANLHNITCQIYSIKNQEYLNLLSHMSVLLLIS